MPLARACPLVIIDDDATTDLTADSPALRFAQAVRDTFPNGQPFTSITILCPCPAPTPPAVAVPCFRYSSIVELARNTREIRFQQHGADEASSLRYDVVVSFSGRFKQEHVADASNLTVSAFFVDLSGAACVRADWRSLLREGHAPEEAMRTAARAEFLGTVRNAVSRIEDEEEAAQDRLLDEAADEALNAAAPAANVAEQQPQQQQQQQEQVQQENDEKEKKSSAPPPTNAASSSSSSAWVSWFVGAAVFAVGAYFLLNK